LIRLTKHALERIKSRNISFVEIREAVMRPDVTFKDKYGNTIAQKQSNDKILRVVYRKKENDIIIITAYKTSKIRKYLKAKEKPE